MPVFQPGLVHTPVTPFTRNQRVDYALYARLLDWHLVNGADSLAVAMHAGESVSLTDREREEVLSFAIEHVAGRVPVIAHVSQSGTALAVALAQQAEKTGAAAIVATTPYYWTPQPAMMLEHFTQIGSAVRIPLFLYNAPDEMDTKISTDLTLKLIAKLDNFIGLVDTSLDWQFLIDVASNSRRVRPDFQLLSGLEFMISAGAIGARGAFAPHAAVAPRLVRQLYELCEQEAYSAARKPQEQFADLYRGLKPHGVAGLKAAMRTMGRDCGDPRDPVPALANGDAEAITAALDGIPGLRDEPRGW